MPHAHAGEQRMIKGAHTGFGTPHVSDLPVAHWRNCRRQRAQYFRTACQDH
jgi:hypothetical protein